MSSNSEIIDDSLKNWKELFDRQNNSNIDNKFIFYEGPPFATGNPHYGHILNGIIKDTVCRWKIMSGFNVPRNAGWDCHGLPIENKMEDKFGIKSKDQIIDFGIKNYNDKCRSMVFECVDQWKEMAKKIGRWIDFDKDYKTMSKSYMECVWNVFKRIYDKDFVYRGFRVMPYSISLGTPLSNFEASSNYKDTSDTCATVMFKLKSNKSMLTNFDSNILVWTTTPWTLPSNTCLAVNKNIIYVLFKSITDDKIYITSNSYFQNNFKSDENIVLFTLSGDILVGEKYTPVFNYNNRINDYRILHGDFVNEEKGTGIVHIAPSFGEDDFNLCIAESVINKDFSNLFLPVDCNGRFTKEVPEFEGEIVFDTNNSICDMLKNSGVLFKKESIVHSYPYCWRSDTKLMYRAVDSWFINVSSISDKLVKNNSEVNWVPESIGKERFNNWLGNAKDWNFSRKRYWGCPIPIWVNEEDSNDIIVIGSIAELKKYTGITINDLHRETVDSIIITKDGIKYRRIEDVMDCWFESGSMPYAKDGKLNSTLVPAEFICEGLDQTRGWFYTLLVISTILDDMAPYKNVIVNGLVLAEDGKKMSKRLSNYPDPNDIIQKYGGDSLRYYLLFSGASYGNSLCFKDTEVRSISNNVINGLYNSCNFYKEYLNLAIKKQLITFEEIDADNSMFKQNISDIWIKSLTYKLYLNVKDKMDIYELKNIGDLVMRYVDDLNNSYIRMNRDRFRNSDRHAIITLHTVLKNISIILASFTPFIAEYINTSIGYNDSVHNKYFEDIIAPIDYDSNIIDKFEVMIDIIDYIRKFRTKHNITGKIPIKKMTILIDSNLTKSDIVDETIISYMKNEGNILQIEHKILDDLFKIDKFIPNFKDYKFKIGAKCLLKMASDANNDKLNNVYVSDKGIEISTIIGDHITRKVSINKKYFDKKSQITIGQSRIVLQFDTEINELVKELYIEKQILAAIQQKRKLENYDISECLDVTIRCYEKDRHKIKLPDIYQTNNINIDTFTNDEEGSLGIEVLLADLVYIDIVLSSRQYINKTVSY
jgi:isoleucyl-tRNA synthetase